MSYTTLKVTSAGVVLFEGHRRRFEVAGSEALTAFLRFAASAVPGIYALHFTGGWLHSSGRRASLLSDGMPVKFAVSPFPAGKGAFPKPAPPGPYDAFRAAGAETLLTSPDGAEIYEGASSAVACFTDGRLVFPPADRPRVDSTAAAAVRAAIDFTEAPIAAASAAPLALLNAVKGICLPAIPGREPFPPAVAERIARLLAATARRE